MFESLVKELAEEITSSDNTRKLRRTQSAQANFEHAIEYFLLNIKRASIPNSKHEMIVQLRNGYYSELNRNNNTDGPILTARQVKAVYDGLLALKLIRVDTRGGYSRGRQGGRSTRYAPTESLLKRIKYRE